jgi:hypothetical protein
VANTMAHVNVTGTAAHTTMTHTTMAHTAAMAHASTPHTSAPAGIRGLRKRNDRQHE